MRNNWLNLILISLSFDLWCIFRLIKCHILLWVTVVKPLWYAKLFSLLLLFYLNSNIGKNYCYWNFFLYRIDPKRPMNMNNEWKENKVWIDNWIIRGCWHNILPHERVCSVLNTENVYDQTGTTLRQHKIVCLKENWGLIISTIRIRLIHGCILDIFS